MPLSGGKGLGVAALLALSLAACAGPTPRPAASTAAPPVAGVKIGNPYVVGGITYYPADDRNYDERGIASWYGPGFHALATANGERYDQDSISAAHKTLPMPSFVEVENLDNGRRLTLRINDRGPFVSGRIIDLSRRSAQLLGVDGPGLAHVRVRRVYPDAATVAALTPPAGVVPPVQVAVQAPATPIAAQPPAAVQTAVAVAAPVVATVELPAPAAAVEGRPGTGEPPLYVQVAALQDAGRAAWLQGYLAAFGSVQTERTAAGLTRVRLGPYASDTAANAALAQVRAAGYSDARIVKAAAP